MNKSIIIGLLALSFYVCASFSVYSQVTIGSMSAPLKGVLLELKEAESVNGESNSQKGLVLPRVFLTAIDKLSPMLTESDPDYENLKSGHTGLVVYNVNTGFSSGKGAYVWDGTKWVSMKSSQQGSNVAVENGLYISADGAIKLGGNLTETTTIDLAGKKLLFETDEGKIGIGTSNPKATVQVENTANIDPLILKNVKFVTDAKNQIDNPSPHYYDLKISENGVIRKAQSFTNLNELFVYTLQANTNVGTGSSNGSTGTSLSWTKSGVNTNYIELHDDGFFVFSFCLLGTINGSIANADSYYISAFKNGTDVASLIDIQEFVVLRLASNNATSNYVNLTVSGKAGDKIYFKLGSAGNKFTLTLTANSSGTEPNKTTMTYWRI